MSVFESYKNATWSKMSKEEKLDKLKKDTVKSLNEKCITEYEKFFGQFSNDWQKLMMLHRGKAVYECLMFIRKEFTEMTEMTEPSQFQLACDGKTKSFAQYTYIYALQQFVRFLDTYTPDDEFYCRISFLGDSSKMVNITEDDSLQKDLSVLFALDLKYHFGNIDGFNPNFLEQLRKRYPSPTNLGLGHAFDYSITNLKRNSSGRREDTGINAAFYDELVSKIIKSWR